MISFSQKGSLWTPAPAEKFPFQVSRTQINQSETTCTGAVIL